MLDYSGQTPYCVERSTYPTHSNVSLPDSAWPSLPHHLKSRVELAEVWSYGPASIGMMLSTSATFKNQSLVGRDQKYFENEISTQRCVLRIRVAPPNLI